MGALELATIIILCSLACREDRSKHPGVLRYEHESNSSMNSSDEHSAGYELINN